MDVALLYAWLTTLIPGSLIVMSLITTDTNYPQLSTYVYIHIAIQESSKVTMHSYAITWLVHGIKVECIKLATHMV